MRGLTDLGIVLFSALICALFQLSLGTLLLLYHASLGAHIRKKTKSLASSFISGVCLMTFLLLATACFLSFAFFETPLPTLALSISVGVLVSLSLVVLIFYFRSDKTASKTTELWLLKPISRFINSRAKITNNNSEAFSLGLLTVLGEIPFTLVLYFLAGSSILTLSEGYETLSLAAFSIISVLPLLILRLNIRNGKTVVDIQRWRVKNKTFFKVLASLSFLILAGFIFVFKILGGGL